jgi:hypothetical protein
MKGRLGIDPLKCGSPTNPSGCLSAVASLCPAEAICHASQNRKPMPLSFRIRNKAGLANTTSPRLKATRNIISPIPTITLPRQAVRDQPGSSTRRSGQEITGSWGDRSDDRKQEKSLLMCRTERSYDHERM